MNDIIKLPKKTPVINVRMDRNKQHATVITSTSIKENQTEKVNKKLKKEGEQKEKEKKFKCKGQIKRQLEFRSRTLKMQSDEYFKNQTKPQNQILVATIYAKMTM